MISEAITIEYQYILVTLYCKNKKNGMNSWAAFCVPNALFYCACILMVQPLPTLLTLHTRMHSSRMRTSRSLTICLGGSASQGGVCFLRGLLPRGCLLPVGCLPPGGGVPAS